MRRGRIERAVLDDRGERSQLLTVYLHISNPNVSEESLAVLIQPALLRSEA
jgi:hypothetical protein